VETDHELPPFLAQMVEAKRLLWNALCERCQRAIEKGQTITADVVDTLAVDVTATLTAFNDSLGRSKDRISLAPLQRRRPAENAPAAAGQYPDRCLPEYLKLPCAKLLD